MTKITRLTLRKLSNFKEHTTLKIIQLNDSAIIFYNLRLDSILRINSMIMRERIVNNGNNSIEATKNLCRNLNNRFAEQLKAPSRQKQKTTLATRKALSYKNSASNNISEGALQMPYQQVAQQNTVQP